MARILLTHSYFLRFDPKQWQIMQPYPPLGTLFAASSLKNKQHQVSLWDPMFSESADLIEAELIKTKPEILVIYDDGFNYLTKMCLTNMRDAAFRMIELANKHNIPSVVCSSDSTDHYDKYLDTGAVAVIKGEGELTLNEFMDSYFQNKSELNNIQGLIYRKDGKTIINAPRSVLQDLDSLPFPAWDLVDLKEYRNRWISHNGYFSINMGTTRGCPFKCNWCAKPIYGNRYNSRSPENVVEEIKLISSLIPFDHIWFCDDIFGLKPGWVKRFADELTANKIKIQFKIQCRVDLLLQENNIEDLARAGCETVWVGAESGSQKVLDAMDKGTQVEQIYKATQLLKKHKIRVAFFLQFGYPGETGDDIKKTIKMVKELLPDDIGISVSYPLPGTKFYENVKHELQSKSNWTDSDELVLMFHNTFPPDFYKNLHRYVHKTYRRKQGWELLKQTISGKATNENQKLRRIAGIFYHLPGEWIYKNRMNTSIQKSGN